MTEQKKNRLLILSWNADKYLALIREAAIENLDIDTATSLGQGLQFTDRANILLASPDKIQQILPQMTNLVWAQSTWAGVNKLMGADCRKDYLLTGVKGIFGPIMAEYVFCYILMHARRALECYLLQQEKEWKMPIPGLLRGKRLGIMGVGSIGNAIAGTARQFNMVTCGLTRSGTQHKDIDFIYRSDNIIEFVSELDYLVSVLPQTRQTDDLIDRKVLKAMKPEALFINVGRGNVVDEDALVEALKSGEISGAVLDVFKEEPLPKSHHLWEAPNTIITSHRSALSYPEDIIPIFIENYRLFIAGKELNYRIDFEKGY